MTPAQFEARLRELLRDQASTVENAQCIDCSHCKACVGCMGCSHCIASERCTQSAYLVRCVGLSGCSYCFGCVGLAGRDFHILNEPYDRSSYFAMTAQLARDLRL